MTRWSRNVAIAFFFSGAFVPFAGAADDGIDFFEKKIRPILVEHCYQCHAKDAKKQRGGLLLDSRAGIRKGGDTGPAVVPGKPAESLLLKAVRHVDPELKMPPKGKLPDAVIADLEKWIALGAPDPRDQKPSKTAGIDFEAAKKHWAYQPLRKPALPAVKNQPATPIDRFILAKLEEKGLTPSPPADARTVLRRLYFDLIGLPPTAEEVAAFAGERWGRHWLDVASYADTKDGVLM
jgi:hypothetical protein